MQSVSNTDAWRTLLLQLIETCCFDKHFTQTLVIGRHLQTMLWHRDIQTQPESTQQHMLQLSSGFTSRPCRQHIYRQTWHRHNWTELSRVYTTTACCILQSPGNTCCHHAVKRETRHKQIVPVISRVLTINTIAHSNQHSVDNSKQITSKI